MNDNELLPNWNEGATKAAILEFVESVTTPGAWYVPPVDRIATFDNDGTLWCEQPQYVQMGLLLGRWKAMIEADPANPDLLKGTGTEKALAEAKERGWTVVSMHDDFKAVFGP